MKTSSFSSTKFFGTLTLVAMSAFAMPGRVHADGIAIPEADTQAPPPPDANEIARIKRAPVQTTNVAPAAVVGRPWVALGPAPTNNAQIAVPPNSPVCGAIQAIAAHPSNADILYIGAIGGGVWRTNNATNANPTWTPLTDTQGSLNIGALEFDPTDGTRQTLVAGVARNSNFAARGGA